MSCCCCCPYGNNNNNKDTHNKLLMTSLHLSFHHPLQWIRAPSKGLFKYGSSIKICANYSFCCQLPLVHKRCEMIKNVVFLPSFLPVVMFHFYSEISKVNFPLNFMYTYVYTYTHTYVIHVCILAPGRESSLDNCFLDRWVTRVQPPSIEKWIAVDFRPLKDKERRMRERSGDFPSPKVIHVRDTYVRRSKKSPARG